MHITTSYKVVGSITQWHTSLCSLNPPSKLYDNVITYITLVKELSITMKLYMLIWNLLAMVPLHCLHAYQGLILEMDGVASHPL